MLLAISIGFLMLNSSSLKVMTYNIRYGTANDGPNIWINRRQELFKLIKRHNPDILGVQEALDFQIGELESELPGFERIGVGRDDGKSKGEYSAIFVRSARLKVEGFQTQWISSDPQKPGSLGPGAHIPRIITSVNLILDRKHKILAVNTHLDHESEEARRLGGRMIAGIVTTHSGSSKIVMGDFNCGPTSEAVRSISSLNGWRLAQPAAGPYGTFNAFNQKQTEGEMIDHIAVGPEYTIERAEIDFSAPNGLVPSDHFPVIAQLSIRLE